MKVDYILVIFIFCLILYILQQKTKIVTKLLKQIKNKKDKKKIKSSFLAPANNKKDSKKNDCESSHSSHSSISNDILSSIDTRMIPTDISLNL